MTQLPKHIKLFHNAWVDYLTSFIKLWLSFNAWYKKEFEHQTITINKTDGTTEELLITQDWQAIKKCKEYPKINWIINNLLTSTNLEENKRFHDPLISLLRSKIWYEIKNNAWNDVFDYYKQSEIRFWDFRPNIDFTVYQKIYNDLYIENWMKECLIIAIFDIIYWLRCKLIHGDFDIEDKIFEKMIFNAHSILHILLEKLIF